MMKNVLKIKTFALLAAAALALTACSRVGEPVVSDPSSQLTASDLIAQQDPNYVPPESEASSDVSDTSSDAESLPEVVVPEEPHTATVTLTAVGDNLIHRQLFQQANARAGGSDYDFAFLYENVADKIAASDIALINQETVIAPDRKPDSYPCFNSPKECGEEIVKIGFDVISMANNHSFDQGQSGLRSCIEWWKTQPVVTTGAYLNEADLATTAVYEADGIRFGFVSFTDPTNGLSLPSDSEMTVLLQSKWEQVEKKVQQARNECDVVVVVPHWGIEYNLSYTETQAQYAQKLADLGADIIIGGHSHCIEPIEMLTASDGRTVPVCYSLGNFVSGQQERMRLIGGMVDFTVTYNFDEGKVTVDDIDFYPLVTHYGSKLANVTVYMYRDYSADLAAQHGIRGITGSSLSREYIEDLVTKVIDEQYLADDWKPAA